MSEEPRHVSPTQKESAKQQEANAEFAQVELPEKRQEGETAVEWFARSLSKPNPSEIADMLRWTQKTLIDENVLEHQMRWITRSIDLLDKLDNLVAYDAFQMKRTMLLVVMADYLGQSRKSVFDREETAGRIAFGKWMKKPELRSVFEEMSGIMQDEVMAHEASQVQRAASITRISAARAAEVRMELLEHPNPWVKLQASRDILQSADRITAAKGGGSTNLNINATLSEDQLQQLLSRATKELEGWDDVGEVGAENGRPVVIVEQKETGDGQDALRLVSESEED